MKDAQRATPPRPTRLLDLAFCQHTALAAIDALGLDLTDRVVVTEAATGPFALTAPIAALAGAKAVHAFGRDSPYGPRSAAEAQTRTAAEQWGVDDAIQFPTDHNGAYLKDVDIVTNCGALRPIDAGMIESLPPTAVVPLMYEAWELRPSDIDLDACRRNGIPVAGTDESHPAVRTMSYLGPLASLLLDRCGIDPTDTQVLVLGDKPFLEHTVVGLRRQGVRAVPVPVADDGTIDATAFKSMLQTTSGVAVVTHRHHGEVIGPKAQVSFQDMAAANPDLVVAHIAGGVDPEDLATSGLRFEPPTLAPAGSMSITTAAVGPEPVITLHAGGLRVGQALREATDASYTGEAAVRHAAATCTLVQPLTP